MNFEIKSRFTSAVMFSCELSAEVAGMEYRFQLGFAVKKAVEAGANLSGANLSDAYLSGANLSGANLSGANLSGAIWRDGITISRAPLYISGLAYPVYILDQHMQIGCELHTLAEWAVFDCERIARMDGVASRRFWKAHGPALLAIAASDKRGVEVVDVAPRSATR